MYDDLVVNFFDPDPHPSIFNMTDFQEMARKYGLKIKTNHMKPFQELKNDLQSGDQLWIFHQRFMMSSYAHVVIMLNAQAFMHVTSAPGFRNQAKLKSKIMRGNIKSLMKEDQCFLVRSSHPEVIIRRRALACEFLEFSYNPADENCESFCSGVHGIWEPSVQGQQIRGNTQKSLRSYAKITSAVKMEEASLQEQMKARFLKDNITLETD